MAIICPWCGAIITGRHKACPNCGVFLTRLSMPNVAPSPSQARSPRGLWLLAIVPLIFTILIPAGTLALWHWNQRPPPASDTNDADPSQDQAWAGSLTALRAKIGNQQSIRFSKSFVQTSAGHLHTLCGQANLVLVQGGVTATRFLALEGRRRDTLLEVQDPGFAVLWTRLCDGSDDGGW